MTADANTRRWVREKPQLIADDLRGLILSGEVGDGASLGRETDLVERYGVSRPCLREALRILETEGLVTVARGARGGVTAHVPDRRIAARMAAMLLQARNVSLADVHGARAYIEPLAARVLAERRSRSQAVRQLGRLVEDQEASVGDPPRFGAANAAFHHELVALAGNQTLGILTEVLDEIVVRSVDVAGLAAGQPLQARRRAIGSQRRLVELISQGDGPAAEQHWRAHLHAVGALILGDSAGDVVDPFALDD